MRDAAFSHLIVMCFVVVMVNPVLSRVVGEDAAEKAPRVALCSPLFVSPGTTSRVIMRGWAIEQVSEILADNPQITVKVLSKGAAAVPDKQDAQQIGDQQVEMEITASEQADPGTVNLTAVTPAGTSEPHSLLIGSESPMLAEQEPNDGFRQAQDIQLRQTIDGQIHADRNVDVFALNVENQTRMLIVVKARQLGSGLDSLLTLFDHRGNIVAADDDQGDQNTDSLLNVTLNPGRYYLSLQDAHDHGGPAYPYRLTVAVHPESLD